MIFFPSHSIIIRRLRTKGTNRQSFSATYTAYQADIQPMEIDRTQYVGGQIGKTYEAWIDATIDVKEGDQLSSGGVIYSVRSVSTRAGAGLLDHKYLIIVAQD